MVNSLEQKLNALNQDLNRLNATLYKARATVATTNKAKTDSTALYNVLHGAEDADVTLDSGKIPTKAKKLKQLGATLSNTDRFIKEDLSNLPTDSITTYGYEGLDAAGRNMKTLSDDLNNTKHNSIFKIRTNLNAPFSSIGILITRAINANNLLQIAYKLDAPTGNYTNFYTRSLVGGTWGNWINFTDLDPANAVNILKVLKNKGDILSFDGANPVAIPIGKTGTVLVGTASSMTWKSSPQASILPGKLAKSRGGSVIAMSSDHDIIDPILPIYIDGEGYSDTLIKLTGKKEKIRDIFIGNSNLDSVTNNTLSNSDCYISYESGKVVAMGNNAYGKLGVKSSAGYITPGNSLPDVKNVADIIDIKSTKDNSAFLSSKGQIWVCGRGNYKQLGRDSTANSNEPILIPGSSWKFVTVSYFAYFAIDDTDTLYVWGHGAPQAGFGDNTNRKTATSVLSNVAKFDVFERNAIALKKDGKVFTWGLNNQGQLGLGDTTYRNTPTEVTALGTDNKDVVAIGSEGCAVVKNDDSVMVAGENYSGSFGTGDQAQCVNFTLVRKSKRPGKIITRVKSVHLIDGLGATYPVIFYNDGVVKMTGRNSYQAEYFGGLYGRKVTDTLSFIYSYSEARLRLILLDDLNKLHRFRTSDLFES